MLASQPSNTAVCTVLDIGARNGLHRRWHGLPITGIGVDADSAECARLNARGGMRFLPYAVGGRDHEVRTLYVTAKPGCSSLVEPNIDLLQQYPAGWAFRVKKRIPVTTTSLDTICDREHISPHVLKIDTQGSELEIMRGGVRTMRSALAVELEVDFLELYKGQPLFRDIDGFMASHGFVLLGLRRDLWRRSSSPVSPCGGQLAHGDALYIHEHRMFHAPQIAQVIWRAYKQHDRLDPSLTPRPSLFARMAGRLLSRVPHRLWRTRVDRLCVPSVTAWHDPEEFF